MNDVFVLHLTQNGDLIPERIYLVRRERTSLDTLDGISCPGYFVNDLKEERGGGEVEGERTEGNSTFAYEGFK